MTDPQHHAPEAWARLGRAVADRRLRRDLSQEDLVTRGGPSHQTVRNIEKGLPGGYRPATFWKLDRSLDWPAGTAHKILDGDATAEDLAALVALDAAEQEPTVQPAEGGISRLGLRQEALRLAIEASPQDTPSNLVVAARIFEEYLRG